MPNDRLRQVEKTLSRQREQLAGKEDALTTIEPAERVRIKQQISDLKAEIRPFETEYWQILAEQPVEGAIAPTTPDITPEIIVAELVKRSGQLRTSQDHSEEVLAWLQKIYAEVSKPGTPAAAKLKGTLSLLPPFVGLSYEAELDTENFLKQNFPTFRKWAGALAKKA